MAALVRLFPGDPAPWFTCATTSRSDQSLDSLAGRTLVLTFPGSDGQTLGALSRLDVFDGQTARCYIVAPHANLPERPLPLRPLALNAFFDVGGAVRALYGVPVQASAPVSFVLSPRLQIVAIVAEADPSAHAAQVAAAVRAQPTAEQFARLAGPPPILVIPGVFEPALCAMLIEGFQRHGGKPSGFMREEDGMTVERFDPGFKVRQDWEITDPKLMDAIGARFVRRVMPEIKRAYNFTISHLERQIVSLYDAESGGHFGPHRDNTTRGTVHRRFACTLNLNADFQGGELRFPEFGPQTYRAPPGGCVIFGASLLHQATRVTSGRRFAFLPFLHDAEAEAIRNANQKYIRTR